MSYLLDMAVLDKIVAEWQRAKFIYPDNFHSAHEGYAVLLEEVDEVWDEIKKKKIDGPALEKELIQVGAMVLRMLTELNLKR